MFFSICIDMLKTLSRSFLLRMAWKSDIQLVRTADRPVPFKPAESGRRSAPGHGTSLHFFVGAAVAVQETLGIQMPSPSNWVRPQLQMLLKPQILHSI